MDEQKVQQKSIETEKLELAVEQPQMNVEFLNQQIDKNVFKSEKKEVETEKPGLFSKNKAAEFEAVGELRSIEPEEVTKSITSNVQADMNALKDDSVAIGILRNIQIYNDIKELDTEERLTQLKTVQSLLDMAFVEQGAKQLQLSKSSSEVLKKYYEHFNKLVSGGLELPTEAPSSKRCYGKIDAVKNPPEEKNFGKEKIEHKDMSSVPLFDHEPHISDIHQGKVGDCFLLGSIAGIVASDPEFIRKMMRDNGDGTVTVRFYTYQTVREFEQQQRWGGKETKDLEPRDRLAKTLSMSDSFSGIKDGAFKNFLSNLAMEGPDIALACADFLLQQKAWDNKEFLPKEGTNEQDLLVESLNKFIASISDTEQAAIAKNMNHTLEQMHKDRESNNIPYAADTVQSELFVTVKKEIAVSTKDGKAKYLRGALWAQMLEKAYAAITTKENADTKEQLKGYQALDMGGSSEDALETITGLRHKKIIDYGKQTSRYGFINELRSLLRVSPAKEENADNTALAAKLMEKVPALKDANEEAVKDLVKLLKKKDIKDGYRAAQIDELMPLIVNSRLSLFTVKGAGAEEILRQRQELAGQLMQLLDADDSVLSYKAFSGKYSAFANNVYNDIENSLKNGNYITASTRNFMSQKTTTTPGMNGEGMNEGVVENHVYTVLGVKKSGAYKYVSVRNPWGHLIRSYQKTKDGKIETTENWTEATGGIFQVELNDFVANYDEVTTTMKPTQV